MAAVPAPHPYRRRGENVAAGVQSLVLGLSSGVALVSAIGTIWGVTESGNIDPAAAILVLLTGFLIPAAATTVGFVRLTRTRGARGWVRTVLGAGALMASPAFVVAVHIGFTGH